MKYKVRENIDRQNIINSLLEARGITDLELYKNPVLSLPNAGSIKNLKELINKLIKNIKNNRKILICVDSDTDGYTSSSIFYQFLRRSFPEIQLDFFVHERKAHGITDELINKVISNGYEVLIVPDAGSNDMEASRMLWERGVDILIIDHHEIEIENEFATIVNNMQDGTNKQFTGAGMAYITCVEMAKVLGIEEPKDLIDLAAIGNIADSAILTSNEIRGMCKEGLSNINNNFVKTIMREKDIKEMTSSDISWKIAPIINGVCRAGSLEERELLFKALNDIHNGETFVVQKRKLNKTTRKYEMVDFEYDFYEYALDILSKCRDKQNKALEPILKDLNTKINENRQIQIFIINDPNLRSNTGLVANKMASITNQPCLVLWEKDNTFTGSARGNTNIMANFKDYCSNTELFSLCQGHDNAFGVIIAKENLTKFIEIINSAKFDSKQAAKEHLVDLVYENGDINRMHMKAVAESNDLWCNGCPEPQFLVTNVTVKKEDVNFYRGGTLKIYSGGITYMKFFAKGIERENFEKGFGDEIIMNVICRFENNEYNGKINQQAIIVDYETFEKEIQEKNINQEAYDFFS